MFTLKYVLLGTCCNESDQFKLRLSNVIQLLLCALVDNAIVVSYPVVIGEPFVEALNIDLPLSLMCVELFGVFTTVGLSNDNIDVVVPFYLCRAYC